MKGPGSHMNEMPGQFSGRAERLGLSSGIAYALVQAAVLLFLGVAVIPNVPPPGESAAARAAAYVTHGDALQLGNYAMLLPVPFLLVFGAAAAVFLMRRRGAGALLPLVILISCATMAPLWPLGGAISTIALNIARAGGDPIVVSSLDAIAPYTLAVSAAPRALLVAALGVASAAARVRPRWLCLAGIPIAGLSIIGSGVMVADWLFPVLALSTLLFLVWTAAIAAAMMRSSRAGADRQPVSEVAAQSRLTGNTGNDARPGSQWSSCDI
jgi:hypothetical protein